MSQSRRLNEEEIKDYFNRKFNLKFDTDAFLSPSKDFVTKIYLTSYLGYVVVREKLAGINIVCGLVFHFKWIFTKFNCGKTFKIRDILSPTRERTTDNFNVIINYWAHRDEELRERYQLSYDQNPVPYDGLPSTELRISIISEIRRESRVFRTEIEEIEEEMVLKKFIEHDRKCYDRLRLRLADLAAQGRVAMGA